MKQEKLEKLSIAKWQRLLTRFLCPLIPNTAREAQLLLMHHIGCDELYLLTHSDEVVKNPQALLEMLKRRMENEPLEYITKRVDFYGEEFFIDSGALIPRPETELLVDEVLKRVPKETTMRFVEVGVGSGIVSIMLAKHLPNARFIATDISKEALRVASENIKRHHLQERIKLVHTDLLEGIDTDNIDYLVSNPPYIQNDFSLESNLSYEPQNALFGGEVGDEIIKALLNVVLKKRIRFFSCEMGYDQKDKIANYLHNKNYKRLQFYKDYAGYDRGFTLELS